jgi:predicted  nucleic acid-binding Zn-ribbon protein
VLSAFKVLNNVLENSSRRVSILGKQAEDWKNSYDVTRQELCNAEEQISRLERSLDQVDTEFSSRLAEADSVKREKHKLESELQVVRQAEAISSKEVSTIQEEIGVKEKCIKQLSLELRRLKSMKTISEMKHKDFTTDSINRCRLSRMVPRQSVPHNRMFSANSPLSSKVTKAFSFEAKHDDFIGEQRKILKAQADDLRMKLAEIKGREARLKGVEESLTMQHNAQVRTLMNECEALKAKIVTLEARNQQLQSEIIERSSLASETGPNLFNELQQSCGDTRSSVRSGRNSRASYERMRMKEHLLKAHEEEVERAQSRCC